MSSIEGLDSLLSKLVAISDTAAERALTRGVRNGTMRVQASAKKLAPARKKLGGRLRGSITTRVEKEADRIVGATGTVVTYAPYVEYGTGQRGDPAVEHREDWPGMDPQPFLRPALNENRELIKQGMVDEIRKELAKYEKR